MGRKEQQIKTSKRNQQDSHMRVPGERLHILFLNLDLSWRQKEIHKAIDLWNDGKNIVEMAQELRPKLDPETAQWEVVLLLIELLKNDKIQDRGTGILGVMK